MTLIRSWTDPGLRAPVLALLLLAAGGCSGIDGDPGDDDGGGATEPNPADGSGGGEGGTRGDDSGSPSPGSGDDTSGMGDAADTTGGGGGLDAAAAELLQHLPGLWVAPVTSNTTAGDFATMNMDVRPADDRTLFSRVDLDTANNLRFAFAIEEHEGEDVLVFRNGGFFQGVLRDTRTRLVEHDPAAGTWRFCAIAGGCAYVDAVFTKPDDDHLELNTRVLRMEHMHWAANRAEPRPLDAPFPYDPTPGGETDPFPAMPQLTVTLDWAEPAQAGTDAWVVLTTTPCGLDPLGCTPSRFVRAAAEPGATSAELVLDQIHPGEYLAVGILDRNGNLGGALLPDTGDGVTLPDRPVTVAASGTSEAALVIAIDL